MIRYSPINKHDIGSIYFRRGTPPKIIGLYHELGSSFGQFMQIYPSLLASELLVQPENYLGARIKAVDIAIDETDTQAIDEAVNNLEQLQMPVLQLGETLTVINGERNTTRHSRSRMPILMGIN